MIFRETQRVPITFCCQISKSPLWVTTVWFHPPSSLLEFLKLCKKIPLEKLWFVPCFEITADWWHEHISHRFGASRYSNLLYSVNRRSIFWRPLQLRLRFQLKNHVFLVEKKSWNFKKSRKATRIDSTRYPNFYFIVATDLFFFIKIPIWNFWIVRTDSSDEFIVLTLGSNRRESRVSRKCETTFYVNFRFSNQFVSIKTELISPLSISLDTITHLQEASIDETYFWSLKLSLESPWNPKKLKKIFN